MARPLLLTLGLLGGCTAPGPSKPATNPDTATAQSDGGTGSDDTAGNDSGGESNPWAALEASIDSAELTDFSVLIGTVDGVQFARSRGAATPDDTLLLASGTKWLAAITLLSLVDEGRMTLQDRPSDHLSWWTTDPADPRSRVTLEQLLSFTSGLTGGINDVPCVEDDSISIDDCARIIYDDFFVYEPGTTFVYGPAHLQVAGAMATAATGQSFHRIFRDRLGSPLGLDPRTGFALPSLDNPRVSGGGTGTPNDYGTVLTALSAGALLSPELMERLALDHTGAGVTLAQVPDEASDGERDWHYALGCWRECNQDPYPAACDEPGVLSSPGAFGFYPWWDTARGFWGVVGVELVVAGGGAGTTIPLGQEWSELAAVALAEAD